MSSPKTTRKAFFTKLPGLVLGMVPALGSLPRAGDTGESVSKALNPRPETRAVARRDAQV